MDFIKGWISHHFLWCCFICAVSGRTRFSLCHFYKSEGFLENSCICTLQLFCWSLVLQSRCFVFVSTHQEWWHLILSHANCQLPRHDSFYVKQNSAHRELLESWIFLLGFMNIWYRAARLVSEVTVSIHLHLHLSLMEYKVYFQHIICIIE